MAGDIRPFEHGDLDAVAALLAHEFPAMARANPVVLRDGLRSLFLEGAFCAPSTPSLV